MDRIQIYGMFVSFFIENQSNGGHRSFLSDGSYQMIADGIEAKDAETAFRGAHTLKGVCLNLGFQKLYEVSAELTEALRDRELKGYEEQFAAVQKQYQITVEAIREWQQEQN